MKSIQLNQELDDYLNKISDNIFTLVALAKTIEYYYSDEMRQHKKATRYSIIWQILLSTYVHAVVFVSKLYTKSKFEHYTFFKLYKLLEENQSVYSEISNDEIIEFKSKIDEIADSESFKDIQLLRNKVYSHTDKVKPDVRLPYKELLHIVNSALETLKFVHSIINQKELLMTRYNIEIEDSMQFLKDLHKYQNARDHFYDSLENNDEIDNNFILENLR